MSNPQKYPQKRVHAGSDSQTIAAWLRESITPHDERRGKMRIHRLLLDTLQQIYRKYEAEGNEPMVVKWQKQYVQVANCQCQWIGYRADCCQLDTRPVAIPIGCNHRMCPLCSAHRSQLAQKRIKTMFDRLTHPVFITLTVPNYTQISKHDFTLYRQKVRTFIKQHSAWCVGGVYSLECTRNRKEGTWHLHAHILADAAIPLPAFKRLNKATGKQERNTVGVEDGRYASCKDADGRPELKFTVLKRQLEFDWLRMWGKTKPWGSHVRANSSTKALAKDNRNFAAWFEAGVAHEIKIPNWSTGKNVPVVNPRLTSAEIAARTAWNGRNRRIVDIRPVTNREKAAKEVLKYITKNALFADLPDAVEQFCDAVRGARLIQTFGSWYGVALEGSANDADAHEWSAMQCTCGANDWKRMGLFYLNEVEMDAGGKWHLISQFHSWSSGTVSKAKIPALAAREAPQLTQITTGDCQLCQ